MEPIARILLFLFKGLNEITQTRDEIRYLKSIQKHPFKSIKIRFYLKTLNLRLFSPIHLLSTQSSKLLLECAI